MFARGRVCGRVGEAQARQVPADLHNLPVLPVVVEFEKGSEVSPTSELGEWPHLFGSRVRHRFATEFANQFGVGLVTLRVGVSLARPTIGRVLRSSPGRWCSPPIGSVSHLGLVLRF